MATVRLTKELMDAIRSAAHTSMQPAVIKAKESAPGNEWSERIYDLMFSKFQDDIARLPSEWFSTTDNFNVSVGNPLQVDSTEAKHDMLHFTLPTLRPWPTQNLHLAHARVAGIAGRGYVPPVATLLTASCWDELYDQHKAYADKLNAALNRQAEFVSMVSKMVNNFTTLAPALKVWPPLWDLLSPEVQARHREVVGKRTREQVTPDVDMNKLTAMAVAAKFSV